MKKNRGAVVVMNYVQPGADLPKQPKICLDWRSYPANGAVTYDWTDKALAVDVLALPDDVGAVKIGTGQKYASFTVLPGDKGKVTGRKGRGAADLVFAVPAIRPTKYPRGY
jgi:predicted RNA-binding protein YlqC (UPF0109 family)